MPLQIRRTNQSVKLEPGGKLSLHVRYYRQVVDISSRHGKEEWINTRIIKPDFAYRRKRKALTKKTRFRLTRLVSESVLNEVTVNNVKIDRNQIRRTKRFFKNFLLILLDNWRHPSGRGINKGYYGFFPEEVVPGFLLSADDTSLWTSSEFFFPRWFRYSGWRPLSSCWFFSAWWQVLIRKAFPSQPLFGIRSWGRFPTTACRFVETDAGLFLQRFF